MPYLIGVSGVNLFLTTGSKKILTGKTHSYIWNKRISGKGILRRAQIFGQHYFFLF
jgi:hypothetical protein